MRKLQAVTSGRKTVPARRRPVVIKALRVPRGTLLSVARWTAAVALPQRFVDGVAWDEV